MWVVSIILDKDTESRLIMPVNKFRGGAVFFFLTKRTLTAFQARHYAEFCFRHKVMKTSRSTGVEDHPISLVALCLGGKKSSQLPGKNMNI